ncbi:hypothetical protein HY523_02835, partial [Candidatus Berkelbacteria bacterium]|nr:hypothetical protein [Candidatus Berkelbacteria bacterium]
MFVDKSARTGNRSYRRSRSGRGRRFQNQRFSNGPRQFDKKQPASAQQVVAMQENLLTLAAAMNSQGAMLTMQYMTVTFTPDQIGTPDPTEIQKAIVLLAENSITDVTGHEITAQQRHILEEEFAVTTVKAEIIDVKRPTMILSFNELVRRNRGVIEKFSELIGSKLRQIWPKLYSDSTATPTAARLTKAVSTTLTTFSERGGVQLFSYKALTHLKISGLVIAPLCKGSSTGVVPTRLTPWDAAELTQTPAKAGAKA